MILNKYAIIILQSILVFHTESVANQNNLVSNSIPINSKL